MSSEQHVEDLLSLYLDNALTPSERAFVAIHLQTCSSCNELLADFRYFDTLLKQQQRVSPSEELRERIFSSPAYLELVGDLASHKTITQPSVHSMRETVPQKRVRFDNVRNTGPISIPRVLFSTPQQETKANKRIPRSQKRSGQRFTLAAIAAGLLLVVGLGSFIGWSMVQSQNRVAQSTQGIVPPQDLRQGGPLPAGMRFIFLHDGSLWSAPEDAKTSPVRLTSPAVTVASNWVVRPAEAGRSAGNLVAYFDLKQGMIHLIRSDGQSDTVIKQRLLATVSANTWNTVLGSTILSSLSWAPDGSTLAFLAAPTGTPTLYTYTTTTGQIQPVALTDDGAVSHLVWAPDAMRIAFESTHNSTTSILDYNVQTHNILVVAPTVATLRYPNDSVMTLDWAASSTTPAITWSVGTQGHVHSIELRDVGVSTTNTVNNNSTLITGDYIQAVYSRSGANGSGGWILTRPLSSSTEQLLTLALNATFYELVNGNSLSAIQWLADGRHISYLDGNILHILDATNGNDTVVARGVQKTPTPSWSPDGLHVVYSMGTQSFVANLSDGTSQVLIAGHSTAFLWSVTNSNTILATLPQAQGNSVTVVQKPYATVISTSAPITVIAWTQIP